GHFGRAEVALTSDVTPGIYELGGPDVRSFRELMQIMLDVIRRRRLVLNIPFPVATVMGFAFEMAHKLTLGIIPAQITRDQVRNLKVDNVASDDLPGFDALGINPTSMESILPEYLWRFRPSGQYDAIKESARNLRT
ncbi:MAG: complex I NDUFA9 subunit family protein, partial [Pseudomonadota bacterium]